MHVNAKAVSLCGLMLALTEVCIALGSVIESNTLFLLAAASYMVGIIVRELGCRMGASFYMASVLLGVFLAPNKIYVFSYGAMGLYILLREILWEGIGKLSHNQNRKVQFLAMKFVIFNLIYLAILCVGHFVLLHTMKWQMMVALFVAGQIGFAIYDVAYDYVQSRIWGRVRRYFYSES